MSSKVTDEERQFLIQFIEEYRSLPALWCVTSNEYSSRSKKNEQYNKLLSKYKERYPNAEKNDVIKKINSMRTCFRRELKKISSASKSGVGADEIPEPTLWYFDQLQFLLPHEKPTSSLSTMDISGQDDLMSTDGDVINEVSIQFFNNFVVQWTIFFCTIFFFIYCSVV